MNAPRLALVLLLIACAPRRLFTDHPGFAPSGSFGERSRVLALDSGVTATIVAPAHLDLTKRVDLILYALPNGNSTAETIGRSLAEGTNWRYDIQHIGAQTRALRARGLEQAIVIVLEAKHHRVPKSLCARIERLSANHAKQLLAELPALETLQEVKDWLQQRGR